MDTNENRGVQYKKWDSPSSKACVLLVHGLGGHTGRWEPFADFLLKNHFTTYAIALPGFGETEGLKGHIDSFSIYFDSIYELRSIIRTEHPEKKIFLVGESLGGLLAFHAAAYKGDFFDGLLMLSPAFKSTLRFGLLQYLDIFLARFYNPKKQFKMPFDPGMCTRDAAIQALMDSDAAEHRQATAKLLCNTLVAQLQSSSAARTITLPLLMLLSGRDMLVDSETSACIFKETASEDKTIIRYPDMYHALSIDIGREKVCQDIVDWIGKRI